MGGCNQSKVVPVSALADGISTGTITKKPFSFWKFFKNRRNIIRVAPALAEDQHITAVSERTIVTGTNQLPTPIRPRSRPDNSPSPTFSEESLSRYMTEDTVDADELLELETAERPPTPDFFIIGTPLFAKKISNKKQLHARQESQEILRQLRDAGIVARPQTSAGGVSYEYFVNEEFGLLNKPPARLQKLKKAKKLREARGDAELREEMESRMKMADERRKDAIDTVRFKQSEHLILDMMKAQETSAQLEENKKQATVERLEQKEIKSQVIQDQAIMNREMRTMQQKQHHTQVRMRGAIKKMVMRDEALEQARKVIQVAPMGGVVPDQCGDEEMGGAISN